MEKKACFVPPNNKVLEIKNNFFPGTVPPMRINIKSMKVVGRGGGGGGGDGGVRDAFNPQRSAAPRMELVHRDSRDSKDFPRKVNYK